MSGFHATLVSIRESKKSLSWYIFFKHFKRNEITYLILMEFNLRIISLNRTNFFSIATVIPWDFSFLVTCVSGSLLDGANGESCLRWWCSSSLNRNIVYIKKFALEEVPLLKQMKTIRNILKNTKYKCNWKHSHFEGN